MLEDGTTGETHGPDPAPVAEPTGDGLIGVTSHGSNIDLGDPERNPLCAADSTHRIVVLYTYLAGHPNNGPTHKATIQDSVRTINAVINESSVASGGASNADLRVKCISGTTQVSVGAFQSSGRTFSEIKSSGRAAGFNLTTEKYLIYADFAAERSDIGGIGDFFPSCSELRETNWHNSGNMYGVTYRPSTTCCWQTRVPLHELGHTMGAVLPGSPGSDGVAHCSTWRDVMCYEVSTVTCSTMWFDCNFDTYFDTAPAANSWLASNWNIGSVLNRFLRGGGNLAPTARFTSSCSRLTCSFDGRGSTDPEGQITSYSWTFGDGTSGSGATPSKTYRAPGTYSVRLTVQDHVGATHSTARNITVTCTAFVGGVCV
jgi:hypothetical protein